MDMPRTKWRDDDAPEDLTAPIDSFGFGKPNSIERQAMLIALRSQKFDQGEPIRVLSSSGKWSELPAEEPIAPSDIMILLPSRSKLRDSIMRELSVVGVPAQADRKEASYNVRPHTPSMAYYSYWQGLTLPITAHGWQGLH